MNIFNSALAEAESKKYLDQLIGAIESALYPFKTGGVTIWYENASDGYNDLIVTVDIKTLGRLKLRFDKNLFLDSYLDPALMIAIEIHEQIKNRPAREINNPNIVLAEN